MSGNVPPADRPSLAEEPAEVPDLVPWLGRRRTVHQFDPGVEIPEDELREMVDAGRKAPSSGNTQTVSFLWIRDPAVRSRIHELCERPTAQVEDASHFLLVCADLRRNSRLLYHRNRDFDLFPITALLKGAVDASLAAGNLMMAAESRGFGVCPIGNVSRGLPQICRELSIPKWVFPVFGLAIGKPDDPASVADTPRVPLDAVLHEDEYSDPDDDLSEACFSRLDPAYDVPWAEKLERYWGPGGFMNDIEEMIVDTMYQQGFFELHEFSRFRNRD